MLRKDARTKELSLFTIHYSLFTIHYSLSPAPQPPAPHPPSPYRPGGIPWRFSQLSVTILLLGLTHYLYIW